MKTVCEINQCVGCAACVDICPKAAITIKDTLSAYNAEIDERLCVDCNACHKVCQVNHPVEQKKPMQWFQGWAKDADVRKNSSSGGLGAELARTVVRAGGVVCSCIFQNGEFRFKFVDKIDELAAFAGSKYVKSNPEGVHRHVKELLGNGNKVLFIGLPCQCAALKNYIDVKSQELLITVDLICHGTPSPQLLDAFLQQYGYSLSGMDNIYFRQKGNFQVGQQGKGIVTQGICDHYSIAFLNSLIYTENCYTCKYAKDERVSDLTIGDSWGSQLSAQEGGKGISLILCNTEKGKQLLDEAELYLTDVNIENAIAYNPQLRQPAEKLQARELFFDGLTRGKRFNSLVNRCCPNKCFRQFVKLVLIKLCILKRGDSL